MDETITTAVTPSVTTSVTTSVAAQRGTSGWVRARLASIDRDAAWAMTGAGCELITWLDVVARRRAASLVLTATERRDAVHDAVAATVHAVRHSSERYLAATNPAAMLEIVVHRRLADEQHRARMCGMAGAARNGRTRRTSYPRRVGGEQAQRILADVPAPTFEANQAIDRAATRIHDWVVDQLGVELDGDPLHATIYVLERLADGVSRASLLRGGHTALSADPALRHLQFTAATARTFAVWLLGKQDERHRFDGQSVGVVDAALLAEPTSPITRARWREIALAAQFVRNARADDPSRRTA